MIQQKANKITKLDKLTPHTPSLSVNATILPFDKAFYMDRGQSIRKQFAKKVRIYLFFFSFFIF